MKKYNEPNLVSKLLLILTALIISTTIIFVLANYLLDIKLDSGLLGAYTNLLVFNATLFTPIAAYFFYDNWKEQRKYENNFEFANTTYLYILDLDIALKELAQYQKILNIKSKCSNYSHAQEMYRNFNHSEIFPLMVECSKLSYTVLVYIERLEHEIGLEKFNKWHSELLNCSNIPGTLAITDETKREILINKYRIIQNSTEDMKITLNRIISNLEKEKSPAPLRKQG